MVVAVVRAKKDGERLPCKNCARRTKRKSLWKWLATASSPVNGSRGYLRRGDTPRILFDKTLESRLGGGRGCDGTRDYGNLRCPASKGRLVFGFQRADRYHLFLARGRRGRGLCARMMMIVSFKYILYFSCNYWH